MAADCASPRHGERKRHRESRPRPLHARAQPRWLESPLGLRVDADGVDEHFGLADLPLQRLNVGAAARIVAVRDDHERLLAIVPGLARAGAPPPPHRRAPCRRRGWMSSELVADPALVARPSLDELRMVAERIEKHFVVPDRRAARGSCSAPRARRPSSRPSMLPLVSSRMPRLTGTRSLLKCVTGLQLVVLVDAEVVLLQTGHEPAVGVGHRGRHVDQLDAGLESGTTAGLRIVYPAAAAVAVAAAGAVEWSGSGARTGARRRSVRRLQLSEQEICCVP